MTNPLLIFFRQDFVEFWSIDQNNRVLPINCGNSNIVPLNFFVVGDQISMNENAKAQFAIKTDGTYGDYWNNILNQQISYNRFNAKYPFSSLLAYSIKENILPDIIRFNFRGQTQDSFLNSSATIVIFDSFIDEDQRNRVNKELIEIVGFKPSTLVSFEYWELFRTYHENKGSLLSSESFIDVNSSLGDLNIHLISRNPPFTLNKKVLKGRGNDPRLDTVLEYIAEIAIKKGSLSNIDDIKKELQSEGPLVLNLLKDGWVTHKIKNDNIGVNPLLLDFHRDAVLNRLNNKSSLHFIQNEFDLFRTVNQANEFKIFLNGEIINQDSFVDFFKSTYSNVIEESNDFEQKFKLLIFEHFQKRLSSLVSNTPPRVNTPHVVNTPPRVNTPPVVNTPPKVNTPLVVNAPPRVNIPPVVNTPPRVNIPPVINTPPRVNTPPVVNVPPSVNTPPVVNTPPRVNTPPVVNMPPSVNTPPVVNAPPRVNTPPVVNAPPRVNTPPVVNAPPRVNAPPVVNAPPRVNAPPVVNAPPRVNTHPLVNAPPKVNTPLKPPKPPPPPPKHK